MYISTYRVVQFDEEFDPAYSRTEIVPNLDIKFNFKIRICIKGETGEHLPVAMHFAPSKLLLLVSVSSFDGKQMGRIRCVTFRGAWPVCSFIKAMAQFKEWIRKKLNILFP